MARDGFRIFDSDTHVGPDARILARYLSEAEKDRLQEWEKFKSVDRNGRETYTRGQRRYRRRLGMAEPDEAPAGYMAGFTGVKRTREPSPLVDADPSERIKDMDHEGVDVNLTLPSGWFGTWTAGDDVALEMAMELTSGHPYLTYEKVRINPTDRLRLCRRLRRLSRR